MKVEDDCGDAMCYKRDIYCIYIIHLYMCFLFLKNCGSSEHLRLKTHKFQLHLKGRRLAASPLVVVPLQKSTKCSSLIQALF